MSLPNPTPSCHVTLQSPTDVSILGLMTHLLLCCGLALLSLQAVTTGLLRCLPQLSLLLLCHYFLGELTGLVSS